jgi:hypothetical protein
MSVAKKKKPYEYSRVKETADGQENLRQIKMRTEDLKAKIEKSILDTPQMARKSALILSMWINGKKKK